jgi:hypothetical protein
MSKEPVAYAVVVSLLGLLIAGLLVVAYRPPLPGQAVSNSAQNLSASTTQKISILPSADNHTSSFQSAGTSISGNASSPDSRVTAPIIASSVQHCSTSVAGPCTEELSLDSGDEVHGSVIQSEGPSGQASLKVTAPSSSVIYQSAVNGTTFFMFFAGESGNYTITLESLSPMNPFAAVVTYEVSPWNDC